MPKKRKSSERPLCKFDEQSNKMLQKLRFCAHESENIQNQNSTLLKASIFKLAKPIPVLASEMPVLRPLIEHTNYHYLMVLKMKFHETGPCPVKDRVCAA